MSLYSNLTLSLKSQNLTRTNEFALYYIVGTAMKQHTVMAQLTELNFLTVLEAGDARSRCWQSWFLLSFLFLSRK